MTKTLAFTIALALILATAVSAQQGSTGSISGSMAKKGGRAAAPEHRPTAH